MDQQLDGEKHPHECETSRSSDAAGASMDAASPPNGGKGAWLQVLGGFLAFMNIWGFVFAFGGFQSFYQLEYLQSYSASTISWIGTVQGSFLIAVGILGGPLFDLGYYRSLTYTGSFLCVFGNMMLSLSTKYYQIFLSQGVCVGIGCGLLYVPSLALVVASFTSKRSIAMGIITAGAGVGGIVYALIFDRLIHKVGFAWTVRVMAFTSLGVFLVAIPCLLALPRKPTSGSRRSLFDKSALSDWSFLVFCLAQFFNFLGYLVPLFYIPTFAQVVLHTTYSTALYLLIITSATSIVGRLCAAAVAHYTGGLIPWIVTSAISGILCFTWIPIKDTTSFWAFCGLYGFFSGAIVALPPAVFPAVCPDPKKLGTRMGMSWASTSVSFLISSPVAGAITGDVKRTRDLLGIQVWSGTMLICGAAVLGLLWVVLVRKEYSHGGNRKMLF